MAVKSRYQTVQLTTNGGCYESRMMPLSAQRSFNLYPEATPQGMSQSVMRSWVGTPSAVFLDNDGVSRGTYVFLGEMYTVVNSTLYKLNTEITFPTAIGDIDVSGVDVVSFSDNGEVMIICGGGVPYKYNGISLSPIAGVDFNPTKAQFLNERFYLNGDDGGVAVSDVLSTNFDPANVFYGRSTPDQTITHYIFNQIIYLFDGSSIEPWQEAGTGAPPVSRINQGIIEDIGCTSINGVTSSDSNMYFIGADGHAYRVAGFAAQAISNSVIAEHFRALDVSNVIVEYVSVNGDKFIIYSFRSDAETWVFSESSEQWFEIGIEGIGAAGFSYSFYAPKSRWYCSSSTYGGLLFLSPTTESVFATETVVRERVIATISGDDIQQPGVMLQMSRIRFSMETGSGTTGSFDPPDVMIVPSFDGGYTFSAPINLSLGRRGKYTLPVELCMTKQFRRAVFKIRVTDEVDKFAIYSASIDIRKAGR